MFIYLLFVRTKWWAVIFVVVISNKMRVFLTICCLVFFFLSAMYEWFLMMGFVYLCGNLCHYYNYYYFSYYYLVLVLLFWELVIDRSLKYHSIHPICVRMIIQIGSADTFNRVVHFMSMFFFSCWIYIHNNLHFI